MLNKNGKYKFFQKDDLFSLSYRMPLIKRNREYLKLFKEESKLRSRSTKIRIKYMKNLDLHHITLCLNVCTKNCKMENFKARKIPPSIDGLNCDQINDNLFASQRLSNQLMKKYDLINKLNDLNIGLIVNCEEEGEHPLCTPFDDSLDPCGFAYSIDELEKNNIHVLKCGWTDFIAPDSFYHMIEIVKKMYYYIHNLNKKILVHCHAGFGRTAITLACYLIFDKKLNAENARKEIRKGARKMCLGGGVQYNYCQEFSEYLKLLRENFFEKNKKDITIFKINEKLLDVGNHKFIYFNDKKYKDNVPLFLLYIFDRIIQIKKDQNIDEITLNKLLINKEIDEGEENNIKNMIKEINNYNWDVINKCNDLKILGRLLFKWLNNSINYVVNINEISQNELSNSISFESLKDNTKNIIQCIGHFISLIKGEKNESNLNLFNEIFIPSLLGYNQLNEYNDKDKQKNIEKLKGFINICNE